MFNGIETTDERAMLDNLLDSNRDALIDTARGLSDTAARRRLVAFLTTPISLIKHAAADDVFGFNGSGQVLMNSNAMATRAATAVRSR